MSKRIISIILVKNCKSGEMEPVAGGITYGLAMESFSNWCRSKIVDEEWDLNQYIHHYLEIQFFD